MKPHPKTIALLSAVMAQSAFSQATFVFANFHPNLSGANVNAPVFDAGGNRLFGNNYVAVLYGGPTMESLQLAREGASSMAPVPIIRIENGQAGYFGTGHFVRLDTVPSEGYAWLQVRAWDNRLGATYEDVAALGLGGYGQSPLFYTYGGGIDPDGRPSQPLRGLQSFSLVPEPGTWALLALGAGALFWRLRSRR